MKVAVIGAGPRGQELASSFEKLGAYVCLFDGGGYGATAKDLSLSDFKPPLPYRGEVKAAHVFQIQKRFLEANETIEGHTRLHDLFRLLYKVSPGKEVSERLDENSQVFEKLGADVIESLKKEVEAFVDVDLVVDARGPFQKSLMMGPGGAHALNEKALKNHQAIFYGREALRALNDLEDIETITIVGSHPLSMCALLKLEKWLRQDGHEVNVITSEMSCFSHAYRSSINDEVKNKTKEFVHQHLTDWKRSCERIRVEIQKWRDLPDYERVKANCPVIPGPKLKIYEGYSVSSVDKLLDREGLFLTMEMAPWRDPDQQKNPIMTVKQDLICVLSGFVSDDSITYGLVEHGHCEPGYYNVENIIKSSNLSTTQEVFHFIESDLAQYFSKA